VDGAQAAALEALADARLGAVTAEEVAAEAAQHFPDAALATDDLAASDGATLDALRRGRPLEWTTVSLTQGDVLDAFAAYCRDELDDLDVVAAEPSRLELGWRERERSAVELRCGFLFVERLAEAGPMLLLGELTAAAVERFLEDEALRAAIAAYDLARLEKVNAVRASAFVHFEWFLRDAYGVKVAPADAFTRGLVERGIISLGMG
jgi:hypothetical protein